MRHFFTSMVCLPAFWASTAFAQAPSVQIATFSDIASDCSCDVDAEAGDTPKAFIEFALSTMWIDAWETNELTKNGQLFLTGEVETEHGTRDMVATLVGKGDKREVRVALGEVGKLNADTAIKRLSAKPIPKMSQPAHIAKSTPNATPKMAAAKTAENPFIGLKYPAPEIVKSGKYSQKIGNWSEVDGVLMAKPGDKYSPRLTERSFPLKRKKSDKALIYAALKDAGLTRAKYPKAEVLEVSMQMVGTHSVIAYGAARRKGKIVRFFVNVDIRKDNNIYTKVLEAPQDEWNSWGGAAVVMAMFGIHEPQAFSPEALSQIRQLSPAQETRFTEEHFTAKMISLFKGIAAANMGTLTSMRSFNMSTSICAGDSNCTVTADGVGGFQAETR